MFVGYLLESEEMERGRENRGDAMRSFHVAQPGRLLSPGMLGKQGCSGEPRKSGSERHDIAKHMGQCVCNQNAAGRRLSVNEARDQSSIGPTFSCA